MGACCCASGDQGTEVKVESQDTAPGISDANTGKPEEPPSQDEKVFMISIDKGDDPSAKIGLDITRSDEGFACLKIKKVKAGHIMNWNKSQPSEAVMQDDLIVEVNGESSSSEKLLERIGKDDKLKIKIKRL